MGFSGGREGTDSPFSILAGVIGSSQANKAAKYNSGRLHLQDDSNGELGVLSEDEVSKPEVLTTVELIVTGKVSL